MANCGKYNLAYALYQQSSCSISMGEDTQTAQFGEDVSSSMQKDIFVIINGSIIYRGDNIQDGAEYIEAKINTRFLSSGHWNAIITQHTASFGFYRCGIREYWTFLRNYE